MPEATQYLTLSEWYALGGGLALGWLTTETIKRMLRVVGDATHVLFFPLLGFLITTAGTYLIWPRDTGTLFPHPIFAALLTGLAAPLIYKVVIALLRKFGQDWLADILTGNFGGRP